MCGINGIISIDGSPIKSLSLRLNLMNKLLNHRGPDSCGIYLTSRKNFGLSNNRLSIVSPKEDIVLPFTKNYNNFLSFNGEIYNYEEIRHRLKKYNIKFTTNTDTEVLYEFLKKFNKEKLYQLNGMWSYAYYDQKKHELLLSRDLLGERHLFYTVEGNELIFSSEIKPIIHASLKKHELDFNSILMSWKFNSCSPGKTLVKNIYRLKPGTNLILKNKVIKLKKFQKLKPQKWFAFFNKKISINEVDKKFEKLFNKEVNLRLPKDVNFIAPLSGGLDSTILSKFIKKTKKNIKTFFSISKNDQLLKQSNKFSEISLSKYISKKIQTDHDIIYPKVKEALREVKDAAKNCFDGCVDPGVANYSTVSRYVNNKKTKVIMFAEGPDELLGGYQCDIEANKIDKIFFKRKLLLKLLSKSYIRNLVIKLLGLKKNIEFEFSYIPFYTRANHSVCPNEFLKKIVKDFNFHKLDEYGTLDQDYKNIFSNLDNSQKRSLIYATKTLPDMFNLRTDKAFMKYSVEARLPFQSVSIAEFFIAMPSKYRFSKNLGKYYLREYAKKNIDKELARWPKHGMGYEYWNNKKIIKELKIKETINKSNFFSYFPFKKDIKKILLDKNTHPGNLWTSYAFIKTFDELNKINKSKI